MQTDFNLVPPHNFLPIMIDGIVLGHVDPAQASAFVDGLRAIKVLQEKSNNKLFAVVPTTLEIAYLAPGRHTKDAADVKNYYYPGVFLSSQVSRFVRPVQNLQLGEVEWIGPLEQIILSIACMEEDIRADSTH